MELPDEIWDYIKLFALNWKRSHKEKFRKCLTQRFGVKKYNREIYERWTHFPPWKFFGDWKEHATNFEASPTLTLSVFDAFLPYTGAALRS